MDNTITLAIEFSQNSNQQTYIQERRRSKNEDIFR